MDIYRTPGKLAGVIISKWSKVWGCIMMGLYYLAKTIIEIIKALA